MERRVNVRGIIVNDKGRLFAVKHRTHEGHESDYWATPGGGLDQGESLHDGLTREFIEEIGVTPKIGKLLFMQQFTSQNPSGNARELMEFFFHVENASDFIGEIDLSATSHGHEITRVDFINPAESDILPNFLRNVDLKSYIDSDLPVRIIDNLHETPR